MYDMIVEHARGFVDVSSNADAKAIQQRNKDRKKPFENSVSKGSGELECYGCGSKDHFLKGCPKKHAVLHSALCTKYARKEPETDLIDQ